jgi:hypothetical protein
VGKVRRYKCYKSYKSKGLGSGEHRKDGSCRGSCLSGSSAPGNGLRCKIPFAICQSAGYYLYCTARKGPKNLMKTAILLVVVLACAAPAHAASYERQSNALKQCFEQKDSGKCMVDAGWKFCPHCAVFGTMLGGECMTDKNGPYYPACWYWKTDEEPESAIGILLRWQTWIAQRGWEKQKTAPFSPEVIPARAADVPCRSLSCSMWRMAKPLPELPCNDEEQTKVFQMECWRTNTSVHEKPWTPFDERFTFKRPYGWGRGERVGR